MGASAAMAQAAPENVPAAQLNKELDVLQVKPDEASDACISAMRELHDTQKKMPDEEDASSRDASDLAVAHDVLESNYETAIEMCGPDARRLCTTPQPSEKLVHACGILNAEDD
nr:hypothetical protein [Acetobacter estunensis]